jgi:prepilin-type N-terminal cleavage/methylation domain-containing protein/prepilin-type processing-associated H-X9-DG protein
MLDFARTPATLTEADETLATDTGLSAKDFNPPISKGLPSRLSSLNHMNIPVRRRAAAFSLVELLVVVAVIGILAALILSSLSKAKDPSKRESCVSNLRQLQLGWHLYMNDQNDSMPPNVWDGVPGKHAGSAPGSWVVGNALDPSPTNIQQGVQWQYNASLPTYHCPLDTSLAMDHTTPRLRSYSLLNYLGAGAIDFGVTAPYNKHHGNELKKPSAVMAFVCEDADSINDGIFLVYPSPATEWKDYPGSRHDQGTTLSFADGHVEYWKWKSAQPNDTEDLQRVQSAIPAP